MKWKEFKAKVKESIKHKHTWQEDQWGKRCQVCGFTKTKKFEKWNKQVRKVGYRICILLFVSLAISGLIMWLLAPSGQFLQEMRRFWFLGNYVEWGVVYFALAFWVLSFSNHFIDESKEEKT